MLNSAPRSGGLYKQGLFIPKNKEKLIKANGKGGVYYISGLEQKMMIYLDNNENIRVWSSEYIKIPYEKTEWDSSTGDMKTSSHTYYPDFYYELVRSDGSTSKVVAEVKPSSETTEPKLKPNPTAKQLKNFEYALKMWNKNLSKWKYMIEWCERKGFEFIIITEQRLK
jgi:hypothetical protein